MLLEESEEQLTLQEQAWINKLAKVMSSGYGADRGSKPTQVRSGVFRGALSVLLPLVDKYYEEEPDDLYLLGADSIRARLVKNKFLPLP